MKQWFLPFSSTLGKSKEHPTFHHESDSHQGTRLRGRNALSPRQLCPLLAMASDVSALNATPWASGKVVKWSIKAGPKYSRNILLRDPLLSSLCQITCSYWYCLIFELHNFSHSSAQDVWQSPYVPNGLLVSLGRGRGVTPISCITFFLTVKMIFFLKL